PDRLVYTFLDAQGAETGQMTLGTLGERARAIASALVAAGATRPPVLVCVGPGAEQPAALFGCFLAGATAVPVYPPGDNPAMIDAIAGVARACGARWLLAPDAVDKPLAPALAERLGDAAPRRVGIERALQHPPMAALPGSGPEDAAIVLYTSGSTGAPKGAVITHRGFVTNMLELAAACDRTADDVICSWLPHGHIAGLFTRLLAVTLGARAVVVPATAFAQRPTIWLEVMSRYRCTVTAAPDFAYALSAQVFSDAAAAELDLSAWTMAVSGGEMVRPTTLDRFYAKFAPAGLSPAAAHPYYGLTETLCTSIPQRTGPSRLTASRAGILLGKLRSPETDADAVTLVGNGQPLGDTEVLAVDPETRKPVEPGAVGELWTRGHAVTREYFADPVRTEEACRATLSDGTGPWFRTGDLGLVHGGQVFITGRLKELIIVRGKNHYPLDVESTVMAAGAAFGARECAAFAVLQDDEEEALGLAVELGDRDSEAATAFLRAVRRAVAERHGLVIHRLYLLAPGGLPRTITNKVSRARCRTLATSGHWDAQLIASVRRAPATAPSEAAGDMRQLTGQALRAALLAQLVALLGAGGSDQVVGQVDRPIAELGLGSIELAGLASALRTAAGVEPPFGAFFDGSTLRDVAHRVADAMEGLAPAERADLGWRDTVRRVVGEMPLQVPPRRTRGGQVLLTGATGFLGAWILRGLLDQGTSPIACLVRAASPEAGMDRLITALSAGPGWQEAWRERLVAVPGDVALPRFGLEPAAWAALAEATAVVVHNAANVNFVAPYAALKAVNVDPVHAVVALALSGGETRPVHVVSTTAVFNASNRREQRRILGSDRLTQPDYLYSGYAQTKWAAETAFRAANIGGLPLAVHRPGLIIGATTTGQSHADDFLCRLIKGCIELGRYPDVDVELDLVPVDDVGFGIAASVIQPLPLAFNPCQWTCPNTVTVKDLFDAFRRRGHRVEPEPLQAWLQRVRTSLPMDNALFPVHPFLFEVPPDTQDTLLEMLDGLPLQVDATEADAVRTRAGLQATPVDAAVLDRMAAWLETTGFLSVAV
ncbi:MAG: thioester reductase domain-containing protein, partial [Candidatus Sericytochromatia bacterium]